MCCVYPAKTHPRRHTHTHMSLLFAWTWTDTTYPKTGPRFWSQTVVERGHMLSSGRGQGESRAGREGRGLRAEQKKGKKQRKNKSKIKWVDSHRVDPCLGWVVQPIIRVTRRRRRGGWWGGGRTRAGPGTQLALANVIKQIQFSFRRVRGQKQNDLSISIDKAASVCMYVSVCACVCVYCLRFAATVW